MTSGYGQVTGGYWPAVVIGAVELIILIMYATPAMRERLRHRDASTPVPAIRGCDELSGEADKPLQRCRALIAEAVVVRQRLSGEIDAETYRARMNDLARPAIPERRPQRNAQ